MGFRIRTWLLALTGSILLGGAVPSPARPLKIVSLNLCADQLLLSLAEPADIAALSPLATDCAESAFCEKARAFRSFRPDSESLWALPPDLVLTGPYPRPLVMSLAQRLGVPLRRVPEVQRLEDIAQQFRQMGQWLDLATSGQENGPYSRRARLFSEAFTARMASILRDHMVVKGGEQPSAIILNEDSTPLMEDMLTRSGFRVIRPPRAALREFLLAHPPSLVVVSRLGEGISLKEQHILPVLLTSSAAKIEVVSLPARLSLCGTMQTLDALDMIEQAYHHLVHETRRFRGDIYSQ